MENLLLEPLKFYDKEGKSSLERNANEHFDMLVKKSSIDVAENRKTAELYRKQDFLAESINKKLGRLKTLRGFLIFFIIISLICAIMIGSSLSGAAQISTIVICCVVALVLLLIIIFVVNKKIKATNAIYLKKKALANETRRLAEGQMASLNASFSEKDTINLIEKTLPLIKFDAGYSVSLSQDFINNFDFDDEITENRSVVDALSGRFNENPFLFYRYVNHYMGQKTYQGSKIISWTETRRDSNGRLRTVRRTQTLIATVSKPYPYYNYGTALSYGNQTSPDLSFSRNATDVEDLSEKQVEKRVKQGQKKLAKLAETAVTDGGNFTEMANSHFDVLFGATNRNHEVQFRVMFSPLAQRNMTQLLRAKDIGYGDDFAFYKKGRFNRIVSEHAQNWTMNTSPENYYSYDVDIARKNFVDFNKAYFKSVFFDLAPLLSIPSYQDKPISTFEPIKNNPYNYTYYDYETLANVIGARKFAHPASVTEVILKARHISKSEDTDLVLVTASSYRAYNRVDFVLMLGMDGRMHSVPVPWVEYEKVEKNTNMMIKKVGLTDKEFSRKANSAGVDKAVFNSPTGYYKGFFAKVIAGTNLRGITEALNKIKTISKEN